MSTETQTSAVLIRRRLDATQPRSVVEHGPTVWVATYRTDGQAHAASLSFHGRLFMATDQLPRPQYIAFPTPTLALEFWVDDAPARHRKPGKAKQGPRPRNVLSGRHIDREREEQR